MCGINAIVDFRTNYQNKQQFVQQMNLTLNHRGPDDHGIWENQAQTIAFGHTRLSILDLSLNGHQPMLDIKTGNVIIFNGEIYNYKELQQNYLKNEQLISQSDTEVLLKLYDKFGDKMLPLLNGMFAFIIWDFKKEELFIARDLSGKKPLYYTLVNDTFCFSSEIKALLTLPFIKPSLDEKAFYDYLTFNIAITPTTLFDKIEKFKPGHFALINKQGFIKYEPFKILEKEEIDFTNESALADEIYSQFSASVQKRMISDVPIGLFLSGGVDSSAILAEMSTFSNSKITTFTIGFENQADYNETLFAEKIAKQFGSNHYQKMVKQQDLLEFLPKITEIYDEPQADSTAIPIYFIAKQAKEKGIKVVLNGDGADELFAGYNNFQKYNRYYPYFNTISSFPPFVKKANHFFVQNLSHNELLLEFSERLSNKQELFWPGASGLKTSQKEKLLSTEFRKKSTTYNTYNYITELKQEYLHFSKGRYDFTEWMCYASYKQAVIERFLFRADRLGMANSIETRSPFLDDSFVQFALSIPSKYKIHHKIPKYILKKSFERILTKETLYRKKMGFCLPLKEWAGSTIINDFEQIYIGFCKDTNLFDVKELKKQLDAYKNGHSMSLNRLWTIYFFMKWYQKWM